MKIKDLVSQIEHSLGRKSHKYLFSLMNDGLDEIAQTARTNTQSATTSIVSQQRWITLDLANMIDVYRVEVLDSEGKYRRIARLTSPPEIGDES
tara:strand:+ start:994 stop:1275 length:282 start_codon:yes stop_codon:yes gene_type:complete